MMVQLLLELVSRMAVTAADLTALAIALFILAVMVSVLIRVNQVYYETPGGAWQKAFAATTVEIFASLFTLWSMFVIYAIVLHMWKT